MNVLDLVIVILLVTSIGGGWRLGLLTGATSWVLLVQSLVVATLVLPAVVTTVGGKDPGMRLMVGILLFVSAGFGGQQLGLLVGRRFHRSLLPEEGPARHWDKVAGAVAAPVAVLLALWLLVLPPLVDAAGSLSDLARHSAVARAIDAAFPDAPETSQALRRLAGPAGAPYVFDGLLPSLDTGPPPTDAGFDPAVVARVSASTVQIEGVACFYERDGSGFSVGPDLVMTNAHVVAGETRTTVVRPDGKRLRAQVVVFDPARDLALLEVPGLGQAPLPLAAGRVGTTAAVFGHPGGQAPLQISPASVRQQLNALGEDLYDVGVTRRTVYVLAAELAPGDSGGPLVDDQGAVIGVAFAISPDNPTTAYALATPELRRVLEAPRASPATTGPCIS
ncbi:MAG TPA: MarP family serine protease [Acidimicrobiales bacterium]|nr:MarP family serine protease [Acidimicrobiales bacterium]